MKTRYFDPPKPRLYGHRGSDRFPENTLPAFADAVAAGMVYLELDVWGSRDGTVMVHHDRNLARVCGLDLDITDMTLVEIRALDAGSTYTPDQGRTFPLQGQGIIVPTLAEVLGAFPEVFITVEIKPDDPEVAVSTLETVLEKEAGERVLLASAEDANLARIRGLAPEIPTNFSFSEVKEFYHRLHIGRWDDYAPLGRVLHIPSRHEEMELVIPEAILAAHRLGVEMHVWTVNEPAEMVRLLQLGVDGLMSDRPWLLAETARLNQMLMSS